MVIYNAELARGKSPEEAAAWAATADAESNSNPAQHQEPHGPGRGLFQWGDNHPNADRRITFQHVMRQSIDHSTIGQQLDFRDWELNNTHRSAKNAIDAARGVADKVRAITTTISSRSTDQRPSAIERPLQMPYLFSPIYGRLKSWSIEGGADAQKDHFSIAYDCDQFRAGAWRNC